MSVAARRWAVGAFGMVAALAVVPSPPSAHAANGDWQVLRWSVDPGDDVAGEVWTITGTISAPSPLDTITDIELTLTRVGSNPNCPNLVVPKHVRDGDGAGGGGGTTTSTSTTGTTLIPTTTSTTTPAASGADTYRFRFEVTPKCNGRYNLSMVGTSDRPNPLEGDTSDPLPMGDPSDSDNPVTVNLRPPDVASATGTVGADRTVTVSWQPPAAYASGVPADFLGYGVDYSYDGGSKWVNGALAETTATTTSFKPRGDDPAGNYMVRVRGIRQNADGTIDPPLIATGGTTAIAVVAVGEPPPPTTTPTTRGGGGNGGRNAPQGTAPPTTLDEGFDPELDYSDLEEGEAEADIPEDASSFLDFVPSSPGSAILVPFAIAECLAVWALHLRVFARRLDGD